MLYNHLLIDDLLVHDLLIDDKHHYLCIIYVLYFYFNYISIQSRPMGTIQNFIFLLSEER